jgi:hypothetical protein
MYNFEIYVTAHLNLSTEEGVVLRQIQVFWDVTFCWWVFPDVSKGSTIFNFQVKHSKQGSRHGYVIPKKTASHPRIPESPVRAIINPLKTKGSLFYIRTQFVPRCKHSTLRL